MPQYVFNNVYPIAPAGVCHKLLYNFGVSGIFKSGSSLAGANSAFVRASALALAFIALCTAGQIPALAGAELTAKITLKTGAASDFAALADGSIVVSNLDSNVLDVYSPAGNHIRSLRPPVDSGDFFRPGAIAVEGTAGFWVVDSYTGRVLRYLNDGNMITSFPLSTGSRFLRSIAAIAVTPPVRAPKILTEHTTAEGESPEKLKVEDHSASGKGEGGLFVLRSDGVISVFTFSGNHKYDLPAPPRLAVPTPAGLYLDNPLLWSLDYESKRVSIYDLDRRNAQPGVVPLKGIPSGYPICGLAGVPGETLIVVLSGSKPVWVESDDGWVSLLTRAGAGSQPPIAKYAAGKLYLLDRDAGIIEVYAIEL